MGAIASQIISLAIVNSTVYSDVDQRKHQSSASLAFVWGIHRRPVNSPHKGPVTRKMFPFDDVIMNEAKNHMYSYTKKDMNTNHGLNLMYCRVIPVWYNHIRFITMGCIINPFGAEMWIFQEKEINTIVTDALAPCIARTPRGWLWFLALHAKWCQVGASFRCRRMIENAN